MEAVINGRELITYTDLLWELALQPGVPISDPGQEDLTRALQTVIDQRLILQEAEKLPPVSPTEKEVQDELARLVNRFPSRAEFFARLNRVGLGENSERLREIVRRRVTIENYVNFRFRSFTVVTQQDVADYYRDVFVPRLRRQAPGRIVPQLEEVFDALQAELIEARIESDIDRFLEESRATAEIVFLDERLGVR